MTSIIPRRLTLSLGLGLLAIILLATPALAGRMWCARDPLVSLGGNDVQIWVAIPQEYESLVTGPITVQINIPKGITARTLFIDDGFNGFGERVTFGRMGNGLHYADGSFDTQVRVQVPIDTTKVKRIPLQVTITVGGVATEVAPGRWSYIGGATHVIQMTNDGAKLALVVPASAR